MRNIIKPLRKNSTLLPVIKETRTANISKQNITPNVEGNKKEETKEVKLS